MEKTAAEIEQERLRERLFRSFHQGCQQYGLLADGDRVLIGLSGGKDSLLLTELLGRQQRIFVPKIQVTAVHVRVKERNYQSDLTYLEDFCREAGVDFRVVDTEIDNPAAGDQRLTTDNLRQKTKDPCFLCAWYRRKALLDLAQELGCNKIALGHHRDDILHTLLMNLTFQGAFATMPPMLKLDKMPLMHIRPLCMIDEKDIVRYAELRGYRKQPVRCPYEHASSRTEIRQLFAELESLNPDIRSSLWNAMQNIKTDYLPKKK
jgi:tRNA(Ile)-lysidine synthase TilS/MesJ